MLDVGSVGLQVSHSEVFVQKNKMAVHFSHFSKKATGDVLFQKMHIF